MSVFSHLPTKNEILFLNIQKHETLKFNILCEIYFKSIYSLMYRHSNLTILPPPYLNVAIFRCFPENNRKIVTNGGN